MEDFKFALDRVRNYKSQVLDKEKKVLATLQTKRNEILEKLKSYENYRDQKITELSHKQANGTSMRELNSLSYLVENARMQIKTTLAELDKADREIEAQRQVVVSIYQEKTGMDKLEEKELEEYHLIKAKTTENELMQVFSSRTANKSSYASEQISGIA